MTHPWGCQKDRFSGLPTLSFPWKPNRVGETRFHSTSLCSFPPHAWHTCFPLISHSRFSFFFSLTDQRDEKVESDWSWVWTESWVYDWLCDGVLSDPYLWWKTIGLMLGSDPPAAGRGKRAQPEGKCSLSHPWKRDDTWSSSSWRLWPDDELFGLNRTPLFCSDDEAAIPLRLLNRLAEVTVWLWMAGPPVGCCCW